MHSSRSSSMTTRSQPRPRRARRPSYKMLENTDLARGSWKRRRGLLGRRSQKMTVEVVVPTLRQVNARLKNAGARTVAVRGRDSQEQRPSPQIKSEVEEMYFLLQATIKAEVKAEEITSENVVRHRLALIGYDTFHIKVPQDILEATTTRCVTSRIWGGNKRDSCPKIGKEFTHGLDDFMYTNLLYDPHAPRRPGSPGLIFKFRDDDHAWQKIVRLIVRLRNNVWQYMGQYKLTAAPPLTPDEWNAQSPKVKQIWAKNLSERKSDGGLKAKIILRKRLGRDPTPQEVAVALKSDNKFHASVNEILQACDEGRAVVYVWCMKCVGYDVDFQRRIAASS